MNTPLDNFHSNTLNHSGPASLFDIIAWIESKNNPHAMRFEPGVYAGFTSKRTSNAWRNARAFNACSDGTADMIFSTSFGATQIMGFNLYDGLYAGDVVKFMDDPIAQAVAFDSFCAQKQIKCTVDDIAGFPVLRAHFAKIYNGDANAYAAQIVYALRHFGVAVTE